MRPGPHAGTRRRRLTDDRAECGHLADGWRAPYAASASRAPSAACLPSPSRRLPGARYGTVVNDLCTAKRGTEGSGPAWRREPSEWSAGVYDISHNAITSAASMGQVGSLLTAALARPASSPAAPTRRSKHF
jgi:hypothetical protein